MREKIKFLELCATCAQQFRFTPLLRNARALHEDVLLDFAIFTIF